MKKYLLILFLAAGIFGGSTFAQIVMSNGTGGGLWTSSSTWTGGVVPDLSNDVIITGTDSVLAPETAQCNNLTVESGGKIASTGTDEESMIVQGRLELQSDAWFYNQAGTPTLPGAVIELDINSTVVHSGSGTIGGPGNFQFGNLILRRNAGTTAAADLVINGNLILENSSNGNGFRLVNVDGGIRTGTVMGDVIINTGLFVCVDVGNADAVGIWNIEGDVYVNTSNSRMGPFSSAGATGLAVFNIAGSLIVNGGRIQVSSSSTHSTGTAIYNIGGDIIMNEGSEVRTNHDGPFAVNFVGTGTQTVRLRGVDEFMVGNDVNPIIFNDTIKVGSNVVFDLDTLEWGTNSGRGGDFLVFGSLEMVGNSRLLGTQSFTLSPEATLKIGSPEGITVSGETGNIQISGSRTFSSEANYEYKGTGAQVLGDGLPASVNGFAVNNQDGIILDKNLNVNGSVNILNGDLDLNGNTVNLGSNAALNESAGNTVKGSTGKIMITTNINAPSSLNVGGLGAVLTAGADLGSTTIERFHSPAEGSGNQGILRQYNITPGQNNSGLNATLKLYYDDSEINGLNEPGFSVFRSADGSDNSWAMVGGTANTTENYVEVSGISDFSYWTIADLGSSLPVEEVETDFKPVEFALHQNYPNPFNPSTVIRFEIPSDAYVNIGIYNSIGEKISDLVNGQMNSGIYSVSFNGESLPSGLYFYRLSTNEKIFTKKMLLIK